jgi:hypothetical protein
VAGKRFPGKIEGMQRKLRKFTGICANINFLSKISRMKQELHAF